MRIFIVFIVNFMSLVLFERFSSVTLEIAGVKFCLLRRYVVNTSLTIDKNLLDASHGIFFELPTYSMGKVGFLLQSRKDREGRGFPEGFFSSAGDNKKKCLKKSSFSKDGKTGWFICTDDGALKNWYFESIPAENDDVYSVHSAFCDDGDMCTLQVNYMTIDVETYIEKRNFKDLTTVLTSYLKMLMVISR